MRHTIRNEDGKELGLYVVTIEHSVYCLAATEQEALQDGFDGIGDEISADNCFARQVLPDDIVEADWRYGIAYGRDNVEELTVKEIIDRMKELPDPRQREFPF